jgi:hypothetical protein
LRPSAGRRVVREAAALGLEHEEAIKGMRDDEIGLAFNGAPFSGEHPVDAVIHDELRPELFEEALVQAALRRALGRQHRKGDHPGHGGMLSSRRSAVAVG